jgi:hypothetical protein
MTLISELIDIPLQVHDGDFVLKLNQGISGAEAASTIAKYVVTDDLAANFDEALGLVASALQDGESKAKFLQGSFGSGKSHFMAMLHLLLEHNPDARAKPELHRAVAKYDSQLGDKKFLLVPIHFLDAKSMEQKILGGYVDAIRVAHPKAPLPPVYLGDTIVADELPPMRNRLGDEAFVDALNSVGGGDDAWGDYADTWTTDRVEQALAAPATDEVRQNLVSAYIAAFRPGTVLEAASTGEGFIDIDRGLAAISVHAQSLGYDGIVLFLDELILWLASRIANLDFVQEEAQKLTKLVEATAAHRPVPIVSFIARQRDLQDLVGQNIAGEQQRSFQDSLEYQSGRFGKIELSSGNLPVVARQRLLTPIDAAASATLRAATDNALGGNEDVKRTLLGTHADIELFRNVYPFSPALVQALIDVSEALQRERTALKVMLQLLVDQRDTLQVGDIIPVGDLWDVVANRDEPFSSELKALFETAKNLWRTKLYPALRAMNNVTDDTPAEARERVALATDERIVKTLLLAALVPEVEAFRGMDAKRLAALNWGNITSPIPGNETQMVANKLKRLRAQVGELLLGADPTNPTVALRLANVDTDDILNRAAESFDNQGQRKLKIRELIAGALREKIAPDLRGSFSFDWRGTARQIDIVFGNVRDPSEIPDHLLMADSGTPKLVIDFPFDEVGRSPEDDLERLDAWADSKQPTTTVCWLPSFFNANGQAALRRYAAADEVLKGDRFNDHTSHLSQAQKAEARPIIESMRDQLAAQLEHAILVAYGVIGGGDEFVDPAASLNEHYRSLDPALTVRPTTQPTLDGALTELCDQILRTLYPGHPDFDAKVTKGLLAKTWNEVQRALAEDDGRIVVEQTNRSALRTVANALKLGTMHESHFVLDDYWRNQLDRHLSDATASGGAATVSQMRGWIDAVAGGPRGLQPTTADLVIATVAAQTDHRLTQAGLSVTLDFARSLSGDVQLVRETLPDAAKWSEATDRAAEVFGITAHRRVTGPELVSLAAKVKDKAAAWQSDADQLVDKLSVAYSTWGIDSGNRLDTARAARDLVVALRSAGDAEVIDLLADFTPPTSAAAVAKSLSSAHAVAACLGRANITLWNGARHVVGDAADAALGSDEIVLAFEPAEQDIERRATAVVAPPTQPVAPGAEANDPTASVGPTRSPGRRRTVRSPGELAELVEEITASVEGGHTIDVTWTIVGDT